MKFIKYTGRYRSVNCLDIDFEREVWTPVPSRLVEKILKNSEFKLKTDTDPVAEPLIVMPEQVEDPVAEADEPEPVKVTSTFFKSGK